MPTVRSVGDSAKLGGKKLALVTGSAPALQPRQWSDRRSRQSTFDLETGMTQSPRSAPGNLEATTNKFVKKAWTS